MQDYELDAFLGDTPVTDEQRAAIRTALDTIGTRYPREEDGQDDWAMEREQAANAAVQVILGDATTEEHAHAWQTVRAQEQLLHAAVTGAIIADERNDSRLAQAVGISRMTIRKARGR